MGTKLLFIATVILQMILNYQQIDYTDDEAV
jgi:hypothetical protein